MTLLILVAGIVLNSLHNVSANVHQIGHVLLTVGIVLVVLEAVLWLIVFLAAVSRR